MSERAGSWGSGQVSGPQIEWRTRMVGADAWHVRAGSIAEGMAEHAAARLAEEHEAEREVIVRLAARPDDWQAMDDRPELAEAADRLLASDLVITRWGSVAFEYQLTTASRRVAGYLADDGRQYRNHPGSNYNGGPLDNDEPRTEGENDEPGSSDPTFYTYGCAEDEAGALALVDHPDERPA